MRAVLLGLALLPVACSREPAPAAIPTATPVEAQPAARDLTGRWTGVEGMVLDVTAGARPGEYRLAMQYDLDHRQETTATLKGGALHFARDGKAMVLRPTDGDGTGLKHLIGRSECLTAGPGEGYCR